jgi:hypothetical protein
MDPIRIIMFLRFIDPIITDISIGILEKIYFYNRVM